jgi:hypothetical protein
MRNLFLADPQGCRRITVSSLVSLYSASPADTRPKSLHTVAIQIERRAMIFRAQSYPYQQAQRPSGEKNQQADQETRFSASARILCRPTSAPNPEPQPKSDHRGPDQYWSSFEPEFSRRMHVRNDALF